MSIRLDDLIGLPFIDGGRDPAVGFDCWGLSTEVFRRYESNCLTTRYPVKTPAGSAAKSTNKNPSGTGVKGKFPYRPWSSSGLPYTATIPEFTSAKAGLSTPARRSASTSTASTIPLGETDRRILYAAMKITGE